MGAQCSFVFKLKWRVCILFLLGAMFFAPNSNATELYDNFGFSDDWWFLRGRALDPAFGYINITDNIVLTLSPGYDGELFELEGQRNNAYTTETFTFNTKMTDTLNTIYPLFTDFIGNYATIYYNIMYVLDPAISINDDHTVINGNNHYLQIKMSQLTIDLYQSNFKMKNIQWVNNQVDDTSLDFYGFIYGHNDDIFSFEDVSFNSNKILNANSVIGGLIGANIYDTFTIDIKNSMFSTNLINNAKITGGGLIGANLYTGDKKFTITEISDSYFVLNFICTSTCTTLNSIEGGGLIGSYGAEFEIEKIYNTYFLTTTINTTYIKGGGIIGSYFDINTGNNDFKLTMDKSFFAQNTINFDTTEEQALYGGGLIGVNFYNDYSGNFFDLNIKDSIVSMNTISFAALNRTLYGGGLIGAYNPQRDNGGFKLNIDNVFFDKNEVKFDAFKKTISIYGGGLIGIGYDIDTATMSGGSVVIMNTNLFEITNLKATFYQNKIIFDGGRGQYNIFGGGLIGIGDDDPNYSQHNLFKITTLNSIFKENEVKSIITTTLRNEIRIYGGGIIGAVSGKMTIDDFSSEFDTNTIIAKTVNGGGLIGVFAGNLDIKTLSSDFIKNNISSDEIYGGGLIGASSSSDGEDNNTLVNLIIGEITGEYIENHVDDVNITGIYGGGLIGVYNLYDTRSGTPAAKTFTIDSIGSVSLSATFEKNYISNIATMGTDIAGGGIIGVVSTALEIKKIQNSFFNLNEITGIYLNLNGGGIIGMITGRDSPVISFKIGDITSTHFDKNTISVYGLSGGGIIGATNSNIKNFTIDNIIDNSSFYDNIITVGDNIYGGGLIGVYTPDLTTFKIDTISSSFIGNRITATGQIIGGGIIGATGSTVAFNFTITNIDGSHFDDNTITTTDMSGGGIIGAQGGDRPNFTITKIIDSFFDDNKINVSGNLMGGGLIGSRMPGNFLINTISGTYFSNNIIVIDGMKSGSAMIGFHDGNTAEITNILGSTFDNNNIEINSDLFGGGIIGGKVTTTFKIGLIQNSSFTNSDKEIKIAGSIVGGGLIGLVDGKSFLIDTIENSHFDNQKITAGDNIYGGGLIGVYSPVLTTFKIGTISGDTISGTSFSNNIITTTGQIWGGGLIGVSGKVGGGTYTIGNITNTHFDSNTISSSGLVGTFLGGGLIGINASDDLSLPQSTDTSNILIDTISNTTFNNNTITYNDSLFNFVYGGGIIGFVGKTAEITNILGSRFDNNDIKAENSSGFGLDYIQGGGLIGALAYDFEIGLIYGSYFTNYDKTIEIAGPLSGGGLIGHVGIEDNTNPLDIIYNAGTFSIGKIENSDFLKHEIIVTGQIIGGGIIGALNEGSMTIGSIIGTTFDSNRISGGNNSYGGGIIGSASSELDIGNIEGSNFDNNIITLDFLPLSDSFKGGGIIGAAKNDLSIGDIIGTHFDINTFTGTDLNICGGGLIGNCNNAIFSDNSTNLDPSDDFYDVYNNTALTIGKITSSFFDGNTITATSIKGGGLFGIQNEYDPTAIYVAKEFNIGAITGTHFDGNKITATGIGGGGLIGAVAINLIINKIEGSFFNLNEITANSGGSLKGGGIIGTSANDLSIGIIGTSANDLSIGDIISTQFNGNTFTGTNLNICGGGLIGSCSDAYWNYGNLAFTSDDILVFENNTNLTIGDITGSNFDGNTIIAKDVSGGGLLGIQNEYDMSGTAPTAMQFTIGAITNTHFDNNEITATGEIYGGLIGSYDTKLIIGKITGSFFDGNTISATSIKGGGLIGSYYININHLFNIEIEGGSFITNNITATEIYGGGLIGASSSIVANNASLVGFSITSITGKYDENTISANTISGGGLFGVYNKYDMSGTAPTAMQFTITSIGGTSPLSATFDNNKIYNITGGGIIGAVSTTLEITKIENTTFNLNEISGGALGGGGIIGMIAGDASPTLSFKIGDIISTNFNENEITTTMLLNGGGLIGVTGAYISNFTINNITGSNFYHNTISVNGIMGGGIIGANTSSGNDNIIGTISYTTFNKNVITNTNDRIRGSAMIGFYGKNPEITNILNSEFNENEIKSIKDIVGGGIIGAAGTSDFKIGKINNSKFNENTIIFEGVMEGGGLIGDTSDDTFLIEKIELTSFYHNNITIGRSMIGAGLIGTINGDSMTIGDIIGTTFDHNTILGQGNGATDTYSGGGLIGSAFSKLEIGDIQGSFFTNNEITLNFTNLTLQEFTGGGIIGAAISDLTIDNIISTEFINNKIFGTDMNILGGGLIGNSDPNRGIATPTTFTITSIADSFFNENKIKNTDTDTKTDTYYNIQGGGLIGAYSELIIDSISNTEFNWNELSYTMYEGGGLIGSFGALTINSITESDFNNNTIGLVLNTTYGGYKVGGLRGGGIIGGGVGYHYDGDINITTISKSNFNHNNIANLGGVNGGGIIGNSYSSNGVNIDTISESNFDYNKIGLDASIENDCNGSSVCGGGIIGTYLADVNIGIISKSSFSHNEIGLRSTFDVGIRGAGIIGNAYGYDVSINTISESKFDYNKIGLESKFGVVGAGIIGINIAETLTINLISDSSFSNNEIKMQGGGAIIGTWRIMNITTIKLIENSKFNDNIIDSSATGTNIDFSFGELIDETVSLIVAHNNTDMITILNTEFKNNITTFTENDGGINNVIAGTIYLTDEFSACSIWCPVTPSTLSSDITLKAESGKSTIFSNNKFEFENGTYYNSFYYRPDALYEDIVLTIDTEIGGEVLLIDPLIAKIDNPNFVKDFVVDITKNQGNFYWGGNNIFITDPSVNKINIINGATGNIYLLDGFALSEYDVSSGVFYPTSNNIAETATAYYSIEDIAGHLWFDRTKTDPLQAHLTPNSSIIIRTNLSFAVDSSINFVLTSNLKNDDTIVKMGEIGDVAKPTLDITNAEIKILMHPTLLKKGDHIDLIAMNDINIDGTLFNNILDNVTSGFSMIYNFNLYIDDDTNNNGIPDYIDAQIDAIIAARTPGDEATEIDIDTLTLPTPPDGKKLIAYLKKCVGCSGSGSDSDSVQLNPVTKSFSEGKITNLISVNQATDTIINLFRLFDNKSNTRHVNNSAISFANINTGYSKYNTGSYIKNTHFSGVAGFGVKNVINKNSVIGIFGEAGFGNYKSYNSFTSPFVIEVNGKGKSNYFGGGALLYIPYTESFYNELSFHLGSVNNDYNSDLVDSLTGISASYKSSSKYKAGHLTTGYIFNMTQDSSINTYLQYQFSEVSADSPILSSGEKIDFKKQITNRPKVGLRFDSKISNKENSEYGYYVGAGVDYEMAGDMTTEINDFEVEKPSIKGLTYSVETGINANIRKNTYLTAGVTGYTGVRNGVAGNLGIKIVFGEEYKEPPKQPQIVVKKIINPIIIINHYKVNQSNLPITYKTLKVELNKALNKYNINLYRDNYKIRIIGHTDATGKEEDNIQLGKKRADVVANALENDFGAENILVGTMADYVVYTKNKNETRRVEIWLEQTEDFREDNDSFVAINNKNKTIKENIEKVLSIDNKATEPEIINPVFVIDNYESADSTIRTPYTKVKRVLDRKLDSLGINLYRDGYKFRIIGHSDAKGKEKAKIEIGKKRANEIAKLLKRDYGEHNIILGTMADYIEVETNQNEYGRGYNRRIEVWLEKVEDFSREKTTEINRETINRANGDIVGENGENTPYEEELILYDRINDNNNKQVKNKAKSEVKKTKKQATKSKKVSKKKQTKKAINKKVIKKK